MRRQRLALDQLHHQEPDLAGALEAVECRDVGMVSDARTRASRSKRVSRSGSLASSVGEP